MRPELSNFVGVMKTAIVLIKTTFIKSVIFKINRNHELKCILYRYFPV